MTVRPTIHTSHVSLRTSHSQVERPQPYEVPRHLHGELRPRTQVAARDVPPDDGHLADAQAALLGEVEDLGVKGPAAQALGAEEVWHHLRPERLQRALRVHDLR